MMTEKQWYASRHHEETEWDYDTYKEKMSKVGKKYDKALKQKAYMKKNKLDTPDGGLA